MSTILSAVPFEYLVAVPPLPLPLRLTTLYSPVFEYMDTMCVHLSQCSHKKTHAYARTHVHTDACLCKVCIFVCIPYHCTSEHKCLESVRFHSVQIQAPYFYHHHPSYEYQSDSYKQAVAVTSCFVLKYQ